MIEANAFNLGARLNAYPRHREAIPVVGIIERVPMILGNARSVTGAKMMGYVFCIQAKDAARVTLQSAADRPFFLLSEA
ncbi:MAG: hypothetical protein AB7O46_00215 [Xanthobacteraceae bacterium]